MSSKSKMVTGVFRNHASADRAYDLLLSHGYTASEVNVLMADATRAQLSASDQQNVHIKPGSQAAEGVSVGGAIGTAVGAALAAIAAIGTTIAIPGLGLFVAGPIVAGLAGAGAGAVTGGALGWLVGVGIPDSNAKAYEAALREGGVVIGVVPRSNVDASWIKDVFTENGGDNVCTC